MSHVVKGKIPVNDLGALARACASVGCHIEDKKTWKWYGNFMNDYHEEDAAYKQGISPEQYGKCDLAIVVDETSPHFRGKGVTYDVGLVKQSDGSYEMLMDFYAGGHGLEKAIGPKGDTLMQRYTIECHKAEALRQGYRVDEEAGEDGHVRLVVEAVR